LLRLASLPVIASVIFLPLLTVTSGVQDLSAVSGTLVAWGLFVGGIVAFVGLHSAVKVILSPIIMVDRLHVDSRRIRWGLICFLGMFIPLTVISLYEWQFSAMIQFAPRFLVCSI
jgi:hypothetical protein